ncbi:exonuclease domain-containing protein [Bounagaea algeriensis]
MITATESWVQGDLLALDFETTGTDTATDRIVTGTVVSIVAGQAPDIRTWLAAPGVDIPEEAAAVHGISTEHAATHGQPPAAVLTEVLKALAPWSDAVPLLVFNAPFDLSLLHAELRRHHEREWEPAGPVVDPLCLGRAMLGPKGKRTLTALCEHYGVQQEQAHSSAGDALSTARLAWKMAKAHPDEIGYTALSTLHEQQTAWYREQQRGFAEFLQRKATPGNPEAEQLRQRAAQVRAEADGWPLLTEKPAVPVETEQPQHVWLDVPFAEKDAAKAAGARWDRHEKRWYAPRPGMAELAAWEALEDVDDLLPGEDRSFGSGLFVDLVPSTCWFTNVRSCVSGKDWERLRRMITRRAEHRCEVCGRGQDRDSGRWLEAHERWSYDDAARTQTLRRLICLCTDCHAATHFGYAQVRGRDEEALRHLCSVTGLSEQDANEHVQAAFELWSKRSAITWELDLSILTNVGVTITPPPQAEDRAEIAHEELDRRN